MHDNDLPKSISESGGRKLPEFGSGDKAPQEQRREPFFSGFEEEDNYEEPDRDTDYTSSYHEESLEDEEFDDSSQDESEFTPQAEIKRTAREPDNNREKLDLDPGPKTDSEPEQTDRHYALTSEKGEEPDDDEWDEEDNDEYSEEDAADFQKWPLGLILVAVVALLLLAAGGYGIIQQRAATQEEIRQLQASLATAARPADVTASRNAVREVQERNTELLAAVDTLTLENRRLTDIASGLEVQLAAQQEALAKQAAAPKPVATPVPVKPIPTPPVTSGKSAWFVNFSSYDQRSTAERWAVKLKPNTGKVVVTSGNKEGSTVYRVRVIELKNRESAEKIARQLEQEYGLPKLWVGRQ